MSRHRAASAYNHYIRYFGPGDYQIGWTVDYYYPTSRQRHPRSFRRNTDLAGAQRFAKRHNLKDPLELRHD